jgi:hypothetical protein
MLSQKGLPENRVSEWVNRGLVEPAANSAMSAIPLLATEQRTIQKSTQRARLRHSSLPLTNEKAVLRRPLYCLDDLFSQVTACTFRFLRQPSRPSAPTRWRRGSTGTLSQIVEATLLSWEQPNDDKSPFGGRTNSCSQSLGRLERNCLGLSPK